MSVDDKRGVAATGLGVDEITIHWQGALHRLTRDAVLKAFDRAPVGDVTGPHARFFMEIDAEMKSIESVFREIIQNRSPIGQDQAELIAMLLRSLGFDILDRRECHQRSTK